MSYLIYKEAGKSPSGKTQIWDVTNQDGLTVLGRIGWYGAWRKYCFYPVTGTVFDGNCLQDIQSFMNLRTQEHREGR